MQNLERAYYFDKESEAVLKCLQYERCAGPDFDQSCGHRLFKVLFENKVKVTLKFFSLCQIEFGVGGRSQNTLTNYPSSLTFSTL